MAPDLARKFGTRPGQTSRMVQINEIFSQRMDSHASRRCIMVLRIVKDQSASGCTGYSGALE